MLPLDMRSQRAMSTLSLDTCTMSTHLLDTSDYPGETRAQGAQSPIIPQIILKSRKNPSPRGPKPDRYIKIANQSSQLGAQGPQEPSPRPYKAFKGNKSYLADEMCVRFGERWGWQHWLGNLPSTDSAAQGCAERWELVDGVSNDPRANAMPIAR